MNRDKFSAYPKHVGIIPDGNRRWAEKNKIELKSAYWTAMQKLVMCIEHLFEKGVLSVSIFLLSKNNLLRARDDLEAVIQAELRLLTELLPQIADRFNTDIYHAGNINLLPERYRLTLAELCESNNGRDRPFPRLYLCAGYDPYDEIAQSLSNISIKAENVLNRLSVPIELDMVVRTGGDYRLSGFLLLQCKYAELFFEPYYFPDITEKRIEEILTEFRKRGRRFGI